MRILIPILAAFLLLAGAAQAQPAAPVPDARVPATQAQVERAPPPPPPTVTLTLHELDALIQAAADTPARWSFQSLQLLLAKRQEIMAAEPKGR